MCGCTIIRDDHMILEATTSLMLGWPQLILMVVWVWWMMPCGQLDMIGTDLWANQVGEVPEVSVRWMLTGVWYGWLNGLALGQMWNTHQGQVWCSMMEGGSPPSFAQGGMPNRCCLSTKAPRGSRSCTRVHGYDRWQSWVCHTACAIGLLMNTHCPNAD